MSEDNNNNSETEKKKFFVFIEYTEPTPAVIGMYANSAQEAEEAVYDNFKDSLPNLSVIRVEESEEEALEDPNTDDLPPTTTVH